MNDFVTGAQIRLGKLVELRPALRNVFSTFLNDGMKPGEDEQGLRARDAAFAELVRRPHFERSQQIFLQARRRFVGDFDARLKENRRKLRMRFGRQPETKIFVRFQRVQFLRREKNDREETREKTTFSKVVNHDVTR